ncbi:MAG: 50S ribosomal protein L20 [Desulfurella sp.]|uniref:Large ribosomal subunit protein bL20 n=1 Tax=Desulfurella multipotens TaxID=79269 RepID=A0A1G6KRU7_9BACT|nr:MULTISPECIES: 50S ribosomal protein L20 [Desulfurella]AHF96770.1 50S ribosomal protein L20 [Desulfurella acetivorans A63]HEX13591.1 50S ribosomal protein L20 [Desulfurella acetivorans]PMP62968.1 MAG: 50S ribosomal protein L20 [Desulfurella multipotens]PMP87442.1 MAG: 50S ribosomal protein L20 [Desulfurella sp.]SDC33799.1 large subunit ribosomal protein L20 [Desulfurella multipotens]
MRVKTGIVRRRRHKKILKLAKGFYQRRHSTFKNAEESVRRALANAYVGRKERKRQFRRLWIARINAAVRENGLTYSQFINLLKQKNILLNRKMLSELAINNPENFKALLDKVRT